MRHRAFALRQIKACNDALWLNDPTNQGASIMSADPKNADPQNADTKNAWNTFTEEIEVTGHQLMDEINKIIAQGNVRKLQIRSEAGDVYLTVPLTAGVVAGGVVAIAAPWLAVIAAVAGLFTKVKLEVLREAEATTAPE
ncbi:DUF4342 domain-containing protein [Devosia sp.]|uniref:DUF4342 domain-containing protein n=1 Tax=Devosia sp. TaxID=1871048 RepID=UPI003BAA9A6B